MDNTPADGIVRQEKKRKSERELRVERRKEAAGRTCGNCKHLHGDHGLMGGRDSASHYCHVCYELCPRKAVPYGSV